MGNVQERFHVDIRKLSILKKFKEYTLVIESVSIIIF